MYVQFGNNNAVEGYRDPTSDDPDLVRYRPLEGERVTTVSFPDGLTLAEAFREAVTAMDFHFAADDEGNRAKPVWIESDSDGLKALLSEHFDLTTKASQVRPKTWGKDTGADVPTFIQPDQED